MEPNEAMDALTRLLEQTICVARALMSLSPDFFEMRLAMHRKEIEYMIQHGIPQNICFQFIHPEHDWYVYVGDWVNGEGKSTPNLPDGTRIAATFDMRSIENKTLIAFEKAITTLKSGFAQYSFQNLANETFKSPIVSSEMTDIATGVDDYFKEKIKYLEKTVEACKKEFNINKIDEFRNWLRKFPDTTSSENPSLLVVNNPDRLRSLVVHLQEERARYCVDALLLGSIQTIYDICALCATEAQKKSLDNTTFAKVFSNLAMFLTISKDKEPVQLLGGTVQKAINKAFVNELLTVVATYQSIVRDKIKEARLSKTIDQSLDHLYYAIPYAFGARTVLNVLCDNADRLEEERKLLVKGSYNMIDETFVRLIAHPFVTQVLDFYGAERIGQKNLIAEIKRTRGEKAAEKYVKDLVRRHLIYPESFIPIFLDQNNPNA